MNILHRRKCKQTLEVYMTDWLETTKKPQLKPSSYDRVEISCRHQIFNHLGRTRLDRLSPAQIQAVLNELSEQRSFSTVKKAYNNLNSCLELAVQRGDLQRNPLRTVVLPKNKKCYDISSYTKDQIQKIVAEATSCFKNGNYRYRYGWAIVLLLNTGMRVGELLYLKWKDVDLDQRYIHVHGDVSVIKTRSETGSSYAVIEQDTPKTAKSDRYISLNGRAYEALIKLKALIGDSVRVISTRNASIPTPRKIHLTMRHILDRCGIEGAKDIVHALRHTFATELIRQGTDIKVVSELLGHSDVSTTIRIYYHTIEAQRHAAMEKLANFY